MMKDRRNFLQNVSAFSALIPLWSNFIPTFEFERDPRLTLEIYATNWGYQGTLEDFCKASKEAGYDGIEVWTPLDKSKREDLNALINVYDLKLGLLSGNSGRTFDEHLKSYKDGLEAAVSLEPEFINCHSGKDYFTSEQGDIFIHHSKAISDKYDIPIYHESHRGRLLYAAHVTEQYMERHENLRLTLDISHWTVVHESLLSDQAETIKKALERTDHIHSRVGFQEGPQIPNPNDPQYEAIVKAHFAWWDEVVRIKSSKGEKLTMTTEFGPPGYMWTRSFDSTPVADNWEVNRAMMHLWKERYLK